MKFNYYVVLLSLFSFIVSCDDTATPKESDTSKTNSESKTFNPDLFVGKWKSVDKGSSFIESWQKRDTDYQGMGFSVIEGKKTDIEFLKLVQTDGKWIYSARVTKQNGNQAIQFESINSGENFIKFSNPKHDDPKSITYKFVGDKTCSVSVEGEDKTSVINLVKTE